MKNPEICSLVLCVEPSRLPLFFQIIESGFTATGKVGRSVKEFLREGMSVSEDYLNGRIQTIFLDGKPVDNIDTAIVKDGSTLSLSAAMPGLVGATMRRGGILSGMRSGISYSRSETDSGASEGKITVKLFNLISRELGPEFLERGIIITGAALSDLFAKNREAIEKGLLSAEINEVKAKTEDILNTEWADKSELLLKVNGKKKGCLC